jgi:hypothetical protein
MSFGFKFKIADACGLNVKVEPSLETDNSRWLVVLSITWALGEIMTSGSGRGAVGCSLLHEVKEATRAALSINEPRYCLLTAILL